MSSYTPPELRDYGSVVELTEATALFNEEDGASKLIPNHHIPPASTPSGN